MQRMRSIVSHPFGGKTLNPGDEFMANAQEEQVLVALGRAIPISDGDQPTLIGTREEKPRKKRGYNRRDMRARGIDSYESK
jgi:hypothetical protein